MNSEAMPRLAIMDCGAVVERCLLPALDRIGWKPPVLVDAWPARLEMIRRLLGYSARFGFHSGMALTRQYLQWAYGDTIQAIAARSAANKNSSRAGAANVD